MKTTILLSDPIGIRAKEYAEKNRMTFTKIVEDALVEYLKNHHKTIKQKKDLKIKPHKSGGFIDPRLEGNWAEIREIIYNK